MIRKSLENKWINITQEAIKDIKTLLSSNKEYDKDFIRLANAIINTNENPWSFMPKNWEGSLSTATNCYSFLSCLHHAMIDDGEVCLFQDGKDYKIIWEDIWNDNSKKKENHFILDKENVDNFIYWLSNEGMEERNKYYEKLHERSQKFLKETGQLS